MDNQEQDQLLNAIYVEASKLYAEILKDMIAMEPNVEDPEYIAAAEMLIRAEIRVLRSKCDLMEFRLDHPIKDVYFEGVQVPDHLPETL